MKYIKEHFQTLITVLICMLIIPMLIYIFVGFKSWMNTDSAIVVEYAIEAIETHTLLPTTWYNCNDFWVYSLVPLIVVFIKMGFSLFYARQLSAFIQSIILFYVLYELLHNTLKDKEGFKIVVLMLLSGISGQFIFEVFGDANYGTIILYMLFSLLLFVKYQVNFYKKYIIILGIFLSIITSFSLRFPVYIGAPIICCILYSIYEKGFKKEQLFSLGTIIISIGVAFLLNLILRHFLLFVANYDSIVIVNSGGNLAENLFCFIYNLFYVSGATYKNMYGLIYSLDNTFISSNSSPLIVLPFIKTIFVIFTVSIPIFLFKKVNKMTIEEKNIYIFIVSFTLILMFFLIMCGMVWYRYVTIIIFYLLLLYPIMYKYYFKKKEKNRVVFYCMILLFVGVSIFNVTFSCFKLRDFSFRVNPHKEITDFLESKGLSFGYVLHVSESNIYSLVSDGKIHVASIDKENKKMVEWASSSRWDDEDYYQGKVFVIRRFDQGEFELEESASEHYVLNTPGTDYMISIFDDNKIILDYFKGDKNEEK